MFGYRISQRKVSYVMQWITRAEIGGQGAVKSGLRCMIRQSRLNPRGAVQMNMGPV